MLSNLNYDTSQDRFVTKTSPDSVFVFGKQSIKQVKVNNKTDNVAYMQVKDLSKNDNEKVFIFNGWTFASDPSLTPFDHAIYNLQLLDCSNA